MTPDQLAQLLQQNPQLGSSDIASLTAQTESPDQIPRSTHGQRLSCARPPTSARLYRPGQSAQQSDDGAQQPWAGNRSTLPEALGWTRASSAPEAKAIPRNPSRSATTCLEWTSSVAPLRSSCRLSGPVDPAYRLGPGDVLALVLTGGVEQTYQLEITRAGFIILPQSVSSTCLNLTVETARAVLFDRLGRVYSKLRGSNPTSSLT